MKKITAEGPTLAGVLSAFLTLCFGPLMPLFQVGAYRSKLINLIWDSLYGVGFAVNGALFDYHALRPILGFVGLVIWPLVLFCLISMLIRAMLKQPWPLIYKVVVSIIFLSTFAFNVTISQSREVWSKRLPSFQNYSDVAY